MEELCKHEYHHFREEKQSANESGRIGCEEEVNDNPNSQFGINTSDTSSTDDIDLKGKRIRLPFVYIEVRYINRQYKVYVREHPSYSCVEIAAKIHYELYDSPMPSDEVRTIRELTGWGQKGEDSSNRNMKSVLNHIYNYRKQHKLARRRGKNSRKCH